jgi:disulfide oxidoreductase YuzD
MNAEKKVSPTWLKDAEEHDFPAAESYLTLIYPGKRAAELAAKLRASKVVQFKAKDIFRASALSLLGVSNSHVEKDKKKILDGKSLSPLLLVRDEVNGKVIVADGYHRLCAVYAFDEDALIPCKIV